MSVRTTRSGVDARPREQPGVLAVAFDPRSGRAAHTRAARPWDQKLNVLVRVNVCVGAMRQAATVPLGW